MMTLKKLTVACLLPLLFGCQYRSGISPKSSEAAADRVEGAHLVAEAVSPNGQNAIRLYANPLCYEVLRKDSPIVLRTPIDLEIDGKGLARDPLREPIVTSSSHSGMTPSDTYKKSFVSLEGNETFANFGPWGVRLAARDDGVAWRFETRFTDEIAVTHERAGFAIPADAACYATNRPFAFRVGKTVVRPCESDRYDFPAWNAVRDSAEGEEGPIVFKSAYRHEGFLTRGLGKRTFPWRCFILADAYSQLCESDIVYALARKNDDLFVDFSWVRPGKIVTGDGIVLSRPWTQLVGDEERMADHLVQRGAQGVRVDFQDGDDVRAERFRWAFADACARRKLLACWHGAPSLAGQDRAYPNVVTDEAPWGLEGIEPCDDLGPSGTRSRHMALMSFQGEPNPECRAFLAKMPVVCEDVKGLGGTPDTYAAVARKAKDGAWWVSVLTRGEARDIEIDTSFLGEGAFEAEIFRDAPDCATEPAHYIHEAFPVEGGDTLKLSLAPGGGAVLRITLCK